MEPAVAVALLWFGFGAFHIGLAAAPVRARLVARLGELGFAALFSLIAAVWFAAVVGYYAAHRSAGAAGPALADVAAARWPLMALVVAGVALMVAALVEYPRLPTALFGQPIVTPRGLERVTRHPFFAGTALLGLAHALLATRLVGSVFALGLALVAILGARHQDAKLVARRGPAYAEYLAATSFVPFAAALAGRQRVGWRELPFGTLVGGVGLALLLRWSHASLFAGGGAWLVLAVVAGAAIVGAQSFRRARRLARRGSLSADDAHGAGVRPR